MNLQEVPIESIKPYWRNPRDIEPAVPAIKASIERYGYQVPILVDKELVIIAGHARYAALVQLGRQTVLVQVADLDPKKAAALRLADNKSHEWSTWDAEKLEAEVRALQDDSAIKMCFEGLRWAELFGWDPPAVPPEPTLPDQPSHVPPGGTYVTQKPICPYCGEEQ